MKSAHEMALEFIQAGNLTLPLDLSIAKLLQSYGEQVKKEAYLAGYQDALKNQALLNSE